MIILILTIYFPFKKNQDVELHNAPYTVDIAKNVANENPNDINYFILQQLNNKSYIKVTNDKFVENNNYYLESDTPISDIYAYDDFFYYSSGNKITRIDQISGLKQSKKFKHIDNISHMQIYNSVMYAYDEKSGIIENSEGTYKKIDSSQASIFSDNFLYYIHKNKLMQYDILNHDTQTLLNLNEDNYTQLGILGRSFIVFNGKDLAIYTHLTGNKYIQSNLQQITLPIKRIITDFNQLYVVPKYYTHIYSFSLRKE